jgi:CheY-like chemotaxis protein
MRSHCTPAAAIARRRAACAFAPGRQFARTSHVPQALNVRALVMDSSADTLDLLRHYLEHHGFDVETCNLARLRSEGKDLVAAVVDARPDVVIFDIALPYEQNWRVCSTLQADPRVTAPFVLTTTNRAAVERLTDARDVVEILGKPYDLDQFARAVRHAVGLPVGDEPHGDHSRSGVDRRAGDRRHGERRQTAAKE